MPAEGSNENYALGAGGESGTVLTINPCWKAHLYGRAIRLHSEIHMPIIPRIDK